MEQHDGGCTDRPGCLADEDGAESWQLEFAAWWKAQAGVGGRAERQVDGVAQSDSTFRTVIVSDPLGAS